MGQKANKSRLLENEAMAKVRNIRTSPQKLNLVAQSIRGVKADKAVASLSFSRKRIANDVKKTLQTAVDTPKDSPNKDEVRSEALTLITDYISRYRNRGMVNKTQSFTTMQTALNAMAGHYKNFASRPLPDKLKERLTKEFSLAEKMVLRES